MSVPSAFTDGGAELARIAELLADRSGVQLLPRRGETPTRALVRSASGDVCDGDAVEAYELRHANGPGDRDWRIDRLFCERDARLRVGTWLGDPARAARDLGFDAGAPFDTAVVAYRPGRRVVLRVGAGGQRTRFAKALCRSDGANAGAIFAALRGIDPSCTQMFVLPIAHVHSADLHVTEAVAGSSLHERLAHGDVASVDEVPELLRRMRSLQIGSSRVLDFAAAREATLRMIERAAPRLPTSAVLTELVARLPAQRSIDSQFVHGDLHDKQVFVTAGGLRVIDFEGASRGDARFDAINFAEHLRLRSLQRSQNRRLGEPAPDAPSHGERLADDLLASVGLDADARDVLAWRGIVRARLAAVYALRPDWSGLASLLADEAATLLSRAR